MNRFAVFMLLSMTAFPAFCGLGEKGETECTKIVESGRSAQVDAQDEQSEKGEASSVITN